MKRKYPGFREAIRLYNLPKVQLTMRFAFLCIGLFIHNYLLMALALFLPYAPMVSKVFGLKVKLDKTGLTADNLKLFEELETRFQELPDNLTKDQVAAEIRAALKPYEGLDFAKISEIMSDGDKGVRAQLLKISEEMIKMKGAGGGAEAPKSVRQQVVEWHEANKEKIAKVKSGTRNIELPPIEVRAAASPMTPANTMSNTWSVPAGVNPQVESGIHDIRRIQPTFWDYITKGRSSSPLYVWVNKKKDADTGEAGWIGPGVAKPGVSFKLAAETSNAKKIAVSNKVALELLDDIDGMTTYIQQELNYQLRTKANTQLMAGAVSSTAPAGIQTVSVPFSVVGISTTNPNNFDVLRAVVAQLRLGFFGGLPVTVFINPVDAANMDLSKAISNGTYLLPPFSTTDGRNVAGALIVEDLNIPAGSFQAACLDLFRVLIYKDFSLSVGWENDDFTKNLVTTIAEMRIHSFHSENDEGAFIFDTFANVKTLIEEA
jgi:hypothetical protein